MRPISAGVWLALLALPLTAQQWSISLASGPFVFGDFADSRTRIRPFTDGDSSVTHSLSADTRAGAAGGIERSFNDRLSARLEASFTISPLAVKSGSGDEAVSLDIGDLSVTTFALPMVLRFNRGGRLRPLVYLGPAWATYDIKRERESGVVPLFTGYRGRLGGIGGAGLEWWWTDAFGLRASASDIITESPLRKSDFPGPTPSSLEIKTPHNVHATAGVAYRF